MLGFIGNLLGMGGQEKRQPVQAQQQNQPGALESLAMSTNIGRAVDKYRQQEALKQLAPELAQMDRPSALARYAQVTGNVEPFFGIGADTPAAIREFEYMQQLSPQDKSAWLANKRASQLVNQGGYTGVFDPLTGGFSNTLDKTLAPQDVPENAAAKAAAEAAARTTATGIAEGQLNVPKLKSAFENQVAKGKILSKNIENAISKVGANTAGYLGSKLSNVAGTEAADLDATLTTIRANLGFDELQQMRNNSPTGGALGAVSENENRLLQSAVTNLENSQSPAQLKKNLAELKRIKDESNQRIKDAYEADIKRFGSPAMGIPPISMNELGGGYGDSNAMPPQLPVSDLGGWSVEEVQ